MVLTELTTAPLRGLARAKVGNRVAAVTDASGVGALVGKISKSSTRKFTSRKPEIEEIEKVAKPRRLATSVLPTETRIATGARVMSRSPLGDRTSPSVPWIVKTWATEMVSPEATKE